MSGTTLKLRSLVEAARADIFYTHGHLLLLDQRSIYFSINLTCSTAAALRGIRSLVNLQVVPDPPIEDGQVGLSGKNDGCQIDLVVLPGDGNHFQVDFL